MLMSSRRWKMVAQDGGPRRWLKTMAQYGGPRLWPQWSGPKTVAQDSGSRRWPNTVVQDGSSKKVAQDSLAQDGACLKTMAGTNKISRFI